VKSVPRVEKGCGTLLYSTAQISTSIIIIIIIVIIIIIIIIIKETMLFGVTITLVAFWRRSFQIPVGTPVVMTGGSHGFRKNPRKIPVQHLD
jgi:hypothetical protein